MTGRRGLGICAIGALDMALWDLRGKVEGKPCWQLLGGAVNPAITPYASLLPEGDDLDTYTRILVERAVKAKELGFRAVKLEVCTKGPYSHNSLQIEDDREIAKIVARLPQGDRPGDDGDGRRRLCLARLEGGAARHRDVRRPGHLLHRDAAAFRRCRRLRQAGEGVARAGRRRRMAEYALRVPGAYPDRCVSMWCSPMSAASAA